jgi:hypothetical protein
LVQYREHRDASFDPTVESRFFTVQSAPLLLHGHLGDAPFVEHSASSLGFDLNIFQDPECPVLGLNISVSLGASLAKGVIRYRMAIVAWTIGWASLVVLTQLSSPGIQGKSLSEKELIV